MRRSRLAPGVAVAVVAAACSRQRVVRLVPAMVSVVVHDTEGDSPVRLDPRATDGILAAALARSKVFRVTDDAASTVRTEGGVQIDAIAREGQGAIVVRVEPGRGVSDPVEALPLSASIAATATLGPGEAAEAAGQRTLRRLLSDAAALLADEERLRRGPSAGVVATIARAGGLATDPNLVLFAARLAGARRDGTAVRPLCKLLDHPRPELRDAALGSLGEIGDRAAVRPIVRSVHDDDPAALARVLDVLGRLGGDDAAAYLELIAAGHDDPEIRRIAARARGRLARAGR